MHPLRRLAIPNTSKHGNGKLHVTRHVRWEISSPQGVGCMSGLTLVMSPSAEMSIPERISKWGGFTAFTVAAASVELHILILGFQ